MPRTRRPSRSPAFIRFAKQQAARWQLAVVLFPLLAMGALGGGRYLAHSHDEHGVHLHPVAHVNGGTLWSAEHDHHHGHEHPAPDDEFPADSDPERAPDSSGDRTPCGIVVSFPLLEHMLGRCIAPVGGLPSAATTLAPAVSISPEPCRCLPIRPNAGRPVVLSACRTTDRIVRTSRALLL